MRGGKRIPVLMCLLVAAGSAGSQATSAADLGEDLRRALASGPAELGRYLGQLGAAVGALFGIGGPQRRADRTASQVNLKLLGTALVMYVQDYDEVLPPMQNPTIFQEVTVPYVRNRQIYLHPRTREPYQTNGTLSWKRLVKIPAQEETVALYEASPEDGGRSVVFVDAHVRWLPETNFAEVLQASMLPLERIRPPTRRATPSRRTGSAHQRRPRARRLAPLRPPGK